MVEGGDEPDRIRNVEEAVDPHQVGVADVAPALDQLTSVSAHLAAES
jgi:hypothetical protein